MRTLDFTVWERLQLMRLVAQQTGDLAQLRHFMRVLDALDLTEDERRAVGWQQGQNGQARWDDAERTFEVELEDGDFELLKTTALGFGRWPVSPLVVQMLEKLVAS